MTKKNPVKTPSSGEIMTRAAIGWNAIGNLPNPNDVLRRMGKISDVHRNLATDSHLSGEEKKRIGAVRNKPWVLTGGPEGPRKEIDDLLWRLNVRDIISQIMKGVARGFRVMEIVWESDGNRTWPKKIVGKPNEAFAFRASDNALMMITRNNISGVPVEPYKFLVAQNEADEENPYGEGYLDKCFWPITFKRGGVKFWMRFIEKYAGAFAIGKVPRNTKTEDKDQLLDSLYDLIQDACAVIPNDGSVEIIEAAGKSASAEIYEKLSDWADKQISKAILGQTLTADIGDKGSYAASNTHYKVSEDIGKDDATLVQSVMNELIGWIWEINFGGVDRPWFSLVAPQDLMLDLTERDLKLSQTGCKFTSKYFVEKYGFNEEHIQADSAPVAKGPALSFAQGDPASPEQQLAVQLADNAAKTDVISPIAKLVENAKSLEEVRDGLLAVFADVSINPIAIELQQAFLAADLAGRFDVLDKAGLLK